MTNAGIEGLCVIGQCKSIEILNLIGTEVTSKGIILALEHLSSLRELKHLSTVGVLAEIHQRALDQNLSDIPKFSLSSIKISSFKLNWYSNLTERNIRNSMLCSKSFQRLCKDCSKTFQ